MGQAMAANNESWEAKGCTLPFWHQETPARVFNVAPAVAEQGIQQGDYVLKVNGQPFTFIDDAGDMQLSKYAEDEVLELEVWRDGETLSVEVTCVPAKLVYRAYQRMAQAMLNGDPDACVDAVDDFVEDIGGEITMSLLGTRRSCSYYGNPDESDAETLEYLAFAIERGLDEYRYFPDDYQVARQWMVDGITTISEAGDYATAASLQRLLAAADDYVESNVAPPDDILSQ